MKTLSINLHVVYDYIPARRVYQAEIEVSVPTDSAGHIPYAIRNENLPVLEASFGRLWGSYDASQTKRWKKYYIEDASIEALKTKVSEYVNELAENLNQSTAEAVAAMASLPPPTTTIVNLAVPETN
jgi:hypothetical protein